MSAPEFIVIVVIALVVLAGLKKGAGRKSDSAAYQAAPLFSAAERSFLGVLDQAVGQRYRILAKVRLADLVNVRSNPDRSAWQSAQNRINSKHVDFVACDPATLGVKCAIELDDSSHVQAERKERDELVDRVLNSAGIPVHRFAVKKAYTVQEIQKVLFPMSQAAVSAQSTRVKNG